MKRLNERSRMVTEEVARAPNRSMYYAMGYEENDFFKPMVIPRLLRVTVLQKLADAAVTALEGAGAKAQMFGTPTVSDGIGMGTEEGMKYSLVSREVIADSIETYVNGLWQDGVVIIVGCDKNMPWWHVYRQHNELRL